MRRGPLLKANQAPLMRRAPEPPLSVVRPAIVAGHPLCGLSAAGVPDPSLRRSHPLCREHSLRTERAQRLYASTSYFSTTQMTSYGTDNLQTTPAKAGAPLDALHRRYTGLGVVARWDYRLSNKRRTRRAASYLDLQFTFKHSMKSYCCASDWRRKKRSESGVKASIRPRCRRLPRTKIA